MKCGHNEPGNENTSYLAGTDLQLKEEFVIILYVNDTAKLEKDGNVYVYNYYIKFQIFIDWNLDNGLR
jgi:hypothetical protein